MFVVQNHMVADLPIDESLSAASDHLIWSCHGDQSAPEEPHVFGGRERDYK